MSRWVKVLQIQWQHLDMTSIDMTGMLNLSQSNLFKLGTNAVNIQCGLISSHFSPLTLEVVGAPQMTLQQYLSILPCLPLPSGNLQTPFPSIP